MKQRLDLMLVEKGLAETRTRAQALILEGKVRVAGQVETKASRTVEDGTEVSVESPSRFVSRGGEKLEGAFAAFAALDATDRVCLDVGSSTGGFTDCLLQHGARRVMAVDVGTNQLDYRLRVNPRVWVKENFNARYMKNEDLPETPTLAVTDVSFISLRLILPPIVRVLASGGTIVALIKPQFEVGKGLAPGGLVRDEALRLKARDEIVAFGEKELGLELLGLCESPIRGREKGNVEYLSYWRKPERKVLCVCLSPAVDATVRLSAWPTDGCILKNAVETLVPGGKTVNVARWLAKRGASVACGGLLGADNAALFERELARYGIADRFIRIAGATRVNEMFVTPAGSFKVNRAANGEGACVADIGKAFGEFDIVIFSGSLPAGWPDDTYRVLIEEAKAAGAKTVLDASGKALVEGVKARPDVIKPNAEECEALLGYVPKTPEEFARATEELKRVCEIPIISDGAAGCWFDGAFAGAPKVDVLDTTAAGDTLLAEWCWRRMGGADAAEAGRWAVAAGSAACTMPGGEPPSPESVARLVESVQIFSKSTQHLSCGMV